MATPLLSAKLIELRQHFNYSQQEIADYLTLSREAYSHYERGNREPSLETLLKLCKLYQINISELINEDTVLLFPTANDKKKLTTTSSIVLPSIITDNIHHFLKLFTGKNSTIDFTNITKEDMEVLSLYKKLDSQSQKEVRQFIKFKEHIKE